MLEYIDLKYRPGSEDLVCEFFIEPSGISIEKAAEHIAGESSIGTWTDLSTMKPQIAKKLKPKVYYIDKRSGNIKIAYPQDLFEEGNMPQVLSSIAGNIYGMKAINKLRLQDISFPKSIIRSFKGPALGVQGIRDMMKVKKRPLCGTIVKPKVGLSAKEHAQVAYKAWVGGVDIVKDDENLSSMKFNDFDERIRHTLEMCDRAQEQTGEKKAYMPNVTAEATKMINRAEYVKKHGGKYVMIDIITCGWSGLQTLRNWNKNLAIHAHRAGHAAVTRDHSHGISMLTIAKISRLIGVDQIHIGTAVGKMDGTAREVHDIELEIEDRLIHEKKSSHILEQKWYDVKPTFAVSSGGLHPGLTDKLVRILGNNIVIQMGGGLFGHPDGPVAGSQAVRQSIDAVMAGKTLKQYARNHPELSAALRLWGDR